MKTNWHADLWLLGLVVAGVLAIMLAVIFAGERLL